MTWSKRVSKRNHRNPCLSKTTASVEQSCILIGLGGACGHLGQGPRSLECGLLPRSLCPCDRAARASGAAFYLWVPLRSWAQLCIASAVGTWSEATN